MAYNVSQIRKNNNTTYMSSVECTPTTIDSPNPFGQKAADGTVRTFQDFALTGNFLDGQTYFLRFSVKKVPLYTYSSPTRYSGADELLITLLLKNDQDETDPEALLPQQIGTCIVPQNTHSIDDDDYIEQFCNFSFVFTPHKEYHNLGFRLRRDTYDAIEPNPKRWLLEKDGQNHLINIFYDNEIGEVSLLHNIGINLPWLKMGYQSRPGNLIVVNNEPIRVGRSGIYEINNGMKIKNFMIAAPNGAIDKDNIDAFLLDYAYQS